LPAVLEILRQVLREPLLPQDQFEIMKRERLAAMDQFKTEPAMLAPRQLQRTLDPYPSDNIRYTPTVDESIQRLKATTYDQVAQLYKGFLGSQTGELSIVGDFDPDACLPVLKKAMADWKSAKPYTRIANPIATEGAGSEQKINTPDKANATYVAGMLFPMRDDDPDYPALVVGNYIFGGGSLSSRLATRVRQHEGLSYSVGSNLNVSPEDTRASFNVAAIANPQNIAKLEKSVQDELDRLLREGVTAEELDKARQGYLEAIKLGRANDTALAASLNDLRYLGRTMAWEADFEKKIGELTPEQVNAALRKHIDPKKLVVVVAGDFDQKMAAGDKAGKDDTNPSP
jgi:zinc protease